MNTSSESAPGDLIQARGLRKSYSGVQALDGLDLTLPRGRILGLIGPNGSGKTTAIKTLLGLSHRNGGTLSVLGMDPAGNRADVMRHTAYIADTGILPRWMKVHQLIDCFAGLHPTFDRQRLDAILADTDIQPNRKVRSLSKGMNVQLHLALILAIDARLLVLDEPTLGLDQLFRQKFYNLLINDFADGERSILITTHEVREVEHLLTDVVFLSHGRKVLDMAMADVGRHYARLATDSAGAEAARSLSPLSEQRTPGGVEFIFAGTDRSRLSDLGEVSTPNLAELFVAIVGGER